MSASRPTANDVDIDLGQLFGAVVRNWLRILVVALVAAGLAFALANMATPKYRAETRVLIESRESVFTMPSNGERGEVGPLLDEQAIASQVEVISSADILRDVADSLDLASREGFGGSGETSALTDLFIMLGLKSDPTQASIDERIVDALREDLTVYRVEGSRVIVIQYSSGDPELAAAVPNAVADAYIAVQKDAKLTSNSAATDWLEPLIADLGERVREAEARVAEYRAKSDLLIGQNNSVLATQQLSELSSELTQVRAASAAAEARAGGVRAALESGASLDSVPEVLSSGMVQRLRDRQVQLSSAIAESSTTLLGNHPRMRALNAQLAETNQQLRAEMRKVLSGLETEAETAQARERQVLAELNRLKAQSAQAGGDEVELRALEREAASQRALLESYLGRFREAASRADRNYLPADARIFSRATPPYEPYFPKIVPITAAAFVGALLVMAIITLIQELFSGRAMRAAPRGNLEPVPVLAMPVAIGEAEPAVEDAEADGDETHEAAVPATGLSIAAAAQRLISGGSARAVFISPEGDEAAAASVMVSREVADAGLRVIFLDLTLSGAPSKSMLESSHYPGITNLLASEAQFADIIRGDPYSDCHVIPAGTADTSRAIRAADRLPIILDSLAAAYDVVVVECGSTKAEGISRVVTEEADVLLSVIDPEDEAVAETAADLAANGYDDVVMVTPVGHNPPAPEGRSVA